VVHLFNDHMASTRDAIYETIHEKRKGPTELLANGARRREQSTFVAGKAADCQGPVLIVSDFNTPIESSIFPEVWGGYTDAFTTAEWGWGYTFFGGKTTVRIDHVLAGKGWDCSACRVGPFVGSPHRPVIADLVWTAHEQQLVFRQNGREPTMLANTGHDWVKKKKPVIFP